MTNKQLNPSQDSAVKAIEGKVTIDAVAGSGKTTVLTHRVKHMLDSGIKPKNILITTFTKKASDEMYTRLATLIPQLKLMQIPMGTTHSIGYRILNKEYEAIGEPLVAAFKKRNVLMNSKHKFFVKDIIKSMLNDRSVAFDIKQEIKDAPYPLLSAIISNNKNAGIGWREYKENTYGQGSKVEAYAEFYERYEKTKYAERAIDGDDMLFLLYKLFREHPDILAKYQKLYKYIMVDEAQDNNGIQYELFRMLAYPENNLFLVGDVDQSMYSFRGARPDEFITYAQSKGTQRIALEDNYRSRPAILDVANKLILNNSQRLDKKLVAHNQDITECISYESFPNESDESDGIAKDLLAQIESGRRPRDMAILYRTNAQSRALEDKLIMNNIPYVIHGGVSFYERKEVKDLVAYLKMAVDPNDDDSLKRVINVPSRYLGKAYMEKISSYKGSLWDAIQDGVITMKPYERRGSDDFIKLVNSLRKMQENSTPSELIEYIMDAGEYEKYILDEDNEEESSRLENIRTLKFVLDGYENISDFLSFVSLMSAKAKHDIDGVQLMTFHKSKGLEFPVVYISGVSEGLLPHFRAIESAKEGKPLSIEEERRLLYVGITRAEEECYVSSCLSFNGNPNKPSRFLKEAGLFSQEVEEDEVVYSTTDEESIDAEFDNALEPIRKELLRDVASIDR